MIRRSSTPSGIAATALTALTTATLAAAVGLEIGGDEPLAAAGIPSLGDADGDGISDVAEAVRLTNPTDADTDGDGFGDLEELARGMDPRLPDSFAPAGNRAIGISTTGDGSLVRTDVALYVGDADYAGMSLEVGVFLKDGAGTPVRLPLPASVTYANGSFGFAQGADPGALVLHFNVDIPQNLYESFGWVGVYATSGVAGEAPTIADAQTIVYEGDALMSVEPQLGVPAFAAVSHQLGGITVTPIEPEDQLPTSMSQDQLCYQTVSPAGSTGGLVTMQVDSADCIEADFLFCSPSCGAAVGSSRTIVDPLSLIGG
ncbi:MAG: hypothetical protein AAFZ65_20250 [Planctomycetota bacterium]